MTTHKADKPNVRALNTLLKPLGRRICPMCGRQLPLDEAHWYRDTRWTNGWRSKCRDCIRVTNWYDPATRAAYQKRWRALHRERSRLYGRISYARSKAKRMAAIVERTRA